MSKKAKELSALEVSRLRKPGYHAVGVVAGLYLQVKPPGGGRAVVAGSQSRGSRSWVLRAMVGSKRRDMGLGPYPDVTLAMAYDKARAAREQIKNGIDPILERERAASQLRAAQDTEKTFEWCAQRYIETHGDSWKNAKHRAQWVSTLETYAYPIIGKTLVRDVGQAQVLAVLEPIWSTTNETAARLRGRLEKVLTWATVRKYREGANPAAWKDNLKVLLAEQPTGKAERHFPALPIDDMGAFMVALRQRDGMAARALEFAILTAARSNEALGATWGEFDLNAAMWAVPGERMKKGKEHRVPLPKQAVTLLRALPRTKDDIVFPSPRKGGKMSDMSMTKVIRDMHGAEIAAGRKGWIDPKEAGRVVTTHGFRSTFRSWAFDLTNYPRDLAETALAHALGDKTEAAYRRSDALERRRRMMQDWAGVCDTPHTAAKVIKMPLRRAA